MGVTAVIGSAVIGAGGSLLAAHEQKSAADKGANTQLKMYNQTRADLLPYMTGGTNAFSQLQNLLGLGAGGSSSMLSTLQNYPGYQFAVQQGQQGLDRSAASRGLLLSGGQLKDTINYNQGMADQLFGTYANQLSGLASLGENAAAMTGNAGTAAASGAANSYLAAGQAGASGIAGATNQIGGLLSNQSLMSQLFGSTAGGDVFGSASGAADIGSLALSDRRAKTEVRRVGTAESGLPIYSYKLRGSPLTQFGVMADEVRRVAPHAVRRAPDGFDRVDYRAVSMLPPMRKAA